MEINVNEEQPNKKNKKYIVVVVVVLLVVVGVVMMKSKKTDAPQKSDSLQSQLENSKELEPSVKSPRNDFAPGKYELVAKDSKFMWEYKNLSGSAPAVSGKLNTLDTGRIENFESSVSLKDLQLSGGDKNTLDKILSEKVLNVSTNKEGQMRASTVLPNTIDEAFTISYTLEALGKSISLASGMYVEHGKEGEIIVRGSIYADTKYFGFPGTENVKISPYLVFKKK